MAENTILRSSPELAGEIERGLRELGKTGYTVQVHESGDPAIRRITFTFGESEQTLEFKNNEWEKSGVVARRIVDHLNI